MADAPTKSAAPAGGSGGGISSDFILFLVKYFLIICICVLALVFVVSSADRAIAFNQFLLIVQLVALVALVSFLGTTFYFMKKFKKVNGEIGSLYEKKYTPVKKSDTTNLSKYAGRYEIIKQHVYSPRESEWRLGVIELDNMLRDVLADNGYTGETIAEQLKMAQERPFGSVENAWEGHKVRNKIAHEGMNFALTEHEVQRVFKLYTTVFEEFKVV